MKELTVIFVNETEKNEQLLEVKDVVKHMRDQPSIPPEDFLKEDFVSSPRYKKEPSRDSKLN